MIEWKFSEVALLCDKRWGSRIYKQTIHTKPNAYNGKLINGNPKTPCVSFALITEKITAHGILNCHQIGMRDIKIAV